MFSISGFTQNLIGILIACVILGAMLGVVVAITIPETLVYADALETMIQIIPLLAGAGLAVAGVYLFITKK